MLIPEPGSFEDHEAEVNGVSMFFMQNWDVDDSGRTYDLVLVDEKDSVRSEERLTVGVSPEVGDALFNFAQEAANDPDDKDHPYAFYILYGKIKRQLPIIEQQQREAAQVADDERREAFMKGLDTSFHQEAEVKQGKVSVKWDKEAGKSGAYVIDFSEIRGVGGRDKLVIGLRIEVAQKWLDYVVESFAVNARVNYIINYFERTFIPVYNQEYLWSQAQGIESPDPLYEKEGTFNELQLEIKYSLNDRAYLIIFPQIETFTAATDEDGPQVRDNYIILDNKTEHADTMFAMAETLANQSSDVDEFYGKMQNAWGELQN